MSNGTFDIPEGMRVKVSHFRKVNLTGMRNQLWSAYSIKQGKLSSLVNPKGGVTIVQILDKDGIVVEGQARCSRKDNFNRTLGRQIATGRALKKLRERENEERARQMELVS